MTDGVDRRDFLRNTLVAGGAAAAAAAGATAYAQTQQPGRVPGTTNHYHVPATDKTVHWGYFSKSLKPVVEVASGDFVTIEVLTHHANDDASRMITGDRMMITHVYLKKGCLVPRHQHMNEQITYILEGALRFRLGANGDEQVDVRAGEVLHIPSNLPHSAEALEDTLDVDVFDPPRQDWLDGTDQYLRQKT